MSTQLKNGVSLRTIHRALTIAAIFISVLMFFSTFELSYSFRRLTETSEKLIELRKAARELMDASDYLTEKVQRFTVDGDMRFLDEYFTEAFESKRREEAINTMSVDASNAAALEKLQRSMDGSMELMEREYYAMRLVIEAKGYTEYPEVLKSYPLSDDDRARSPEEKMRLASKMVLDDEYYAMKEQIRDNMRASLDELERMAYDTDASAIDSLKDELTLVRVVIVIQSIGIVFMVWLTARLGIHPILNAVSQIKENGQIPEVGANEFRYLARAYNKMYDANKRNLDQLNFKASHDELTGAYNRAGYELLLADVDLNTTYVMLVDVDNFKKINDEYGHDVGDKVLKKLVSVLKKNFRENDHICRLGGDEFVVFMLRTEKTQNALVASKFETINKELNEGGDGLPPISISVGIAHGTDAPDVETLMEKADEAMYSSKKRGKRTYTFYSENEKEPTDH